MKQSQLTVANDGALKVCCVSVSVSVRSVMTDVVLINI